MRNTSTSLPLFHSSFLPEQMPALTSNSIALLQGLMESWGWHDQRANIYTAELNNKP